MPIQEIEVPDGRKAFSPFTVEVDHEPIVIECFASRMPVEYVLDGEGNPTEEEKYTPEERAHMVVANSINRQVERYQIKQGVTNATVIKDIVS